jgi:integrase/recombinase XerD
VRTRGAARPTFPRLLDLYVEDLRARKLSLSAQENATLHLPRLFAHLKALRVTDPRAVSETHLMAFARSLAGHRTRQGRPLSPWSQVTYLVTVRGFFAFLEKSGVILASPARALPLPRLSSLPRNVLSETQARRLMHAPSSWTVLGKRDRAILETLYGTGIRRGECRRLDLMDLDLSQATLLVRNGKGRKDRLVPVPGRAAVALDVYLRESRPELARDPRETALFLSREGRRPHPSSIHFIVRKHARAARLPVRPSVHALRHAYATHLLAGGADIRHVQRLLGHRSIETTAVYARVGVRDLREAVKKAHPREKRGRRGPHL